MITTTQITGKIIVKRIGKIKMNLTTSEKTQCTTTSTKQKITSISLIKPVVKTLKTRPFRIRKRLTTLKITI
jgi:hypothetical protein